MVSIDSKYDELKNFYKLLSNFKNHKPITNEIKYRKNRIINNSKYSSKYDFKNAE